MWDNSSIIMGDRRGEIAMSAADTFSKGLKDYYANKEKLAAVQGENEGIIGEMKRTGDTGTLDNVDPKLMEKIQNGKGTLDDHYRLNGQLNAGRRMQKESLDRQRELQRQSIEREMAGVQMTGAQLQNRVSELQIADEQAKAAQRNRGMEEAAGINRAVDSSLQASDNLKRGVGQGIYTNIAQQDAAAMADSPAADLRRAGVTLTPQIMTEIATKKSDTNQLIRRDLAGIAAKASGNAKFSGGPEVSADGNYQRSSPDSEWKPIAEKKNDAKALTAQELQQIQALNQSSRDLDTLEKAFAAMKDPNWGGPVAGRARALDPTSVNVSRINGLVTAATPNLARGVFLERGVLTDMDIDRYKKLLPNVNDTSEQRTQKLADLRARLVASKQSTLDTLMAAGRDVSGLQEQLRGQDSAPNETTFTDVDGQSYPVVAVRGQRGVIKAGKFYPLVQ